MTKAMAWPAGIVVLAFMLRNQIRNLIPLLRSLKYKDLELEFGQELKQIESEAASALPELSTTIPVKLIFLARSSPRAAVLEAWQAVQMAAIAALEQEFGALPEKARGSQYNLLKTVDEAGILDHQQIGVYQHLRYLRNEAVHNPKFGIGTGEAFQYADLAYRLIRTLEEVRKKKPNKTDAGDG